MDPQSELHALRGKIAISVRSWRQFRKLTQRELAEKAGCGLTYISHIEAGRKLPSFPMLVRLADVLGVNFRVLI